jgi:Family of unknown function (DUF6519)
MPSDRSRNADRTRFGYTGTVAQQGRVILDRDLNAQHDFIADRIAHETIDVVGPCGTPDDGFRISVGPFGSPPHFWSPPPTSPPAGSPPDGVGSSRDFLISPGTMYVGGQRVVFYGKQDGSPITYSYFDQPDWPEPDPPSRTQRELVYLDVTELEVSATEDPDLLEVALGGPDTTQRIKLLRRVRRLAVDASNCASAWQQAVARWSEQGLAFDPETMRLQPRISLQVGFTQDPTTTDPCDPVATGGYLGTDNQLIRVRAGADRDGPYVLWGYDNASFLYRVKRVTPNGMLLTLTSDPPDGFHVPQKNQVVEILPTAAVLGVEPDQTSPGGSGQILRVAANPVGILSSLTSPYGPVVPDDPTNYLAVDTPVQLLAGTNLPLFVRVWQAKLARPGSGTELVIADPNTGISTGLTVTLSGDSVADAFWQIAVRPSTPQGVYPEELLTKPQPPDGPRRWVCPLAVIDWGGEVEASVTDCRNPFDNLVELTRRKPGCCTVTVGPADVTGSATLQSLIDRAVTLAEQVTVCLGPGIYYLQRPLVLSSRHIGITIEACGGGGALEGGSAVGILPDPSADPALFIDGLIVLVESPNVTLRGLTLEANCAPVPEAVLATLLKGAAQRGLPRPQAAIPTLYAGIGIRVYQSVALMLDECRVAVIDLRKGHTGDLLTGCMFVQGNCSGITVQNCLFAAAVAPTFTPIAFQLENAAPTAAANMKRLLEVFDTPLTVPASSPASPTPTPPVSAAARMDVAFSLLIAHRQTSGAAGTSSIVATVGILASDASNLDCELGDARLCENAFRRLTFATLISGSASSLRMQDNSATRGVAGLWFEWSGATLSDDAEPNVTFYPQAKQFEEYLLASSIATAYPPPAGEPPPAGGPGPGLGRPEFSLFVTGNQIETMQVTGTAPGQWAASSALLLGLDTGLRAELNAPYLSVIVSSNYLRGAIGIFGPVALVVLPPMQPCAITGNVVVNFADFGRAVSESPSLWVVSAGGDLGTQRLAISGNSLTGFSSLTGLPRSVGAAGGWHTYNADPA